jgi:hypothetical protein
MGREKSRNNKTQVHFYILSNLDKRLEEMSAEIGWSKTKIIEDALFIWLSERTKEFAENKRKQDGLVKTR